MQDQDAPKAGVEAGDGAGAVHLTQAANPGATGNNTAESTAPPWITATAPH